MRVSLLFIIGLIAFVACNKKELVREGCRSHSNLSLSINDSLRIDNCDTIPLVIWISPITIPTATHVDTTIYQFDTLYVKFSHIGEYSLNLGISLNNSGSYAMGSEKISVN